MKACFAQSSCFGGVANGSTYHLIGRQAGVRSESSRDDLS